MRFSNPAIWIFLLFTVLTATTMSCKKQQLLNEGGELKFSNDTLTFDTVFTASGSFTLGVKIFNPQGQKVVISSVRLEKGASSFFHLNVDGYPGNDIKNIEVAANDSIYVYATVNIDRNNDTIPFIIQDKLIATLNGKEFSIPFIAYGQNAYYIVSHDTLENLTGVLKTDKPYVIIHGAAVYPNNTLTIPAGARIYMNADSRLYVLGKLIANGTKKDSIIFQGDRLDRKYFGNEDYPGEWGGIYIDTGSTGNELDWVVLKNGGNSPGGGFPSAMWISGTGNGVQQLKMNHTYIQNSIGYGMICFNANLRMENSMVHSTGAQAIAVFQGGTYTINNCNFLNYFPTKLSHIDNPTAAFLNYYKIDDNNYLYGDLDATITNSMIYGSLEDELVCDRRPNKAGNVTFTNCLLKTKSTDAVPSWVVKNNCKINTDPQFKDYQKQNYRAKDSNSPLVDAGNNGVILFSPEADLDDKNRRNGTIDIGCFEFQ